MVEAFMKNTYKTAEEMYSDNRKLVYAFLTDYEINFEDKKDIAQTIWLKVFANTEKFMNMDRKHFKNYLRTAVKTTVMDFHREAQRSAELAEELLMHTDGIEKGIEQELFGTDYVEYLTEACKTLSDQEQLLLSLRYLKNLSYETISELFGVSEEAVRKQHSRLMKKLKNEILGLEKGRE